MTIDKGHRSFEQRDRDQVRTIHIRHGAIAHNADRVGRSVAELRKFAPSASGHALDLRSQPAVRAFFEALYEDQAFGTRPMQEAFFVACDQRGEFQLIIGFAGRAKPGLHSFRIVHSSSGSKVVPVSLNRLNDAHYSPAELEWVDTLARRLSD